MARLSKNAVLRFVLNGEEIDPPLEWETVQVSAFFENDNVQANLEIDSFTFVRESYLRILQYIQSGKNGGTGIFEGMPFQIFVFNNSSERIAFDGYLDLTEGLQIIEHEQKIICRLIKKEGLNNLDKRIESLTMGYLEAIGVFTDSDYTEVEYVVEKPLELIELISTKIIFFVLVQQLINQVREVARDISNAAGEAAGGLTGVIGSAILTAASIIFQVAYAASILGALLELGRDLFNSYLSPVRTHKTLKLGTGMRKIAGYLGLSLQTDIELLDRLVYLPSNIQVDEVDSQGFLSRVKGTQKGIPNDGDFGYNVSEFFQLVKDLFYAKYVVKDGVLFFYPRISEFWTRTANYELPDVLDRPYSYNTGDLKSNILLIFQKDVNDLWTLENYKGTSYGVNTDAIIENEPSASLIGGFEQFRFPVALGNRKESLTGLEKALKSVGNTFDDITKVFGGRSNFSNRVKNRIGTLKVSDNNTTVPKILYLNTSGKIPSNHRDLFSAKVLWQNYHKYMSLVDDNFSRQRKVYDSIQIPFGFESFLKVIDNSYLQGVNGKITKLNWSISEDTAVISYWIKEVYTKNLKETFIEQE